MYDVIVIGGGPVGSRVAGELAGRGYEVAVLEQKDSPGEGVCCTGIVSLDCVRQFKIDEGLILKKLASAAAFSPSGKALRLRRAEDQAAVLNRLAFDRAMAASAESQGVRYLFRTQVRSLAVKTDRVSLEALSSGDLRGIDGRAVVIAAGANSRLTELLGLGRIRRRALGAQAEVFTPIPVEMEIYFGEQVAPGYFAWLVPVSVGRARVGLLSRHSPGRYLRALLTSLAAEGKIASAEAGISYGQLPLEPLGKTHGDRLMIVGTAAGQVKPTTGGGIYFGLLCADIAASTLHLALQANDLSARRLASYSREWRMKLGPELMRGQRIRRFYGRLSDLEIDELFDRIRVTGLDERLLRDGGVTFDWHGSGLVKILGDTALSRFTHSLKDFFNPLRRGR